MFRTVRADTTLALLALALGAAPAAAQQAIDEEYTALIAEHLQDERITTELVDHLPASETVPTPLDFHGRIVGTPEELTYAADIHRYLYAIAEASPRAEVWSIGLSEEGREMIVMAIADEETIANLDDYQGFLQELTDPRETSDERAQVLIDGMAKPIYWLLSGMHSTENGGPEMLQELAYRLVVQETDFVRTIRDNVITFITPVIEVDGRERQVDTYYFNKDRPEEEPNLPLMYWGKYVAHDNNRDAMGQMLQLTKNVNRRCSSSGHRPSCTTCTRRRTTCTHRRVPGRTTRPSTPSPITEWWMLAENDVLQMTKRDVPGVWTYNFYDGWTPNYMFTIAHAHNAIGALLRGGELRSAEPHAERQRHGHEQGVVPAQPAPLRDRVGPAEQHQHPAVGRSLFSLKYTADHAIHVPRQLLGEEQALGATRNRRSSERLGDPGQPASSGRRRGCRQRADDVRASRSTGPTTTFEVGGVEVASRRLRSEGRPAVPDAGRHVPLAAVSSRSRTRGPTTIPAGPSSSCATSTVNAIEDPEVLERDMTLLTSPATGRGRDRGTGRCRRRRPHDRQQPDGLPLPAPQCLDARGRSGASRWRAATSEPEPSSFPKRTGATTRSRACAELGLSGWATTDMPEVTTHELDVPRIGYIHSWRRTQDEGWVRGALDHYGVPYDYFADKTGSVEGNLRDRYDVIIYPHVGGSAQAQVDGIAMTGELPLPYQRTAEHTPTWAASTRATTFEEAWASKASSSWRPSSGREAHCS